MKTNKARQDQTDWNTRGFGKTMLNIDDMIHQWIDDNAPVEHEIWSGWMKYLFSCGEMNPDGTWTMPAWAVERWTKQMNLKYGELSEQERESDREQARKHVRFAICNMNLNVNIAPIE